MVAPWLDASLAPFAADQYLLNGFTAKLRAMRKEIAMRGIQTAIVIGLLGLSLSGCAVASAAGTVVGVAGTVVGTAVDVTSDVVGAAADVATGGDSKKDDKKDDDKKPD